MCEWISINRITKIKELKANIRLWYDISCDHKIEYTLLFINGTRNKIKELLTDLLPHGSGINCEWKFTFYKNGSIKCSNFFYAMNEGGFYMEYYPISIKIYRLKKNIYRRYGVPKTHYQIIEKKGELQYKLYAPNCSYYAYGLKDALYGSFNHNLGNLLNTWEYSTIEEKDFQKPYEIVGIS